MPSPDPNALFSRAEQAFLAGRLDAARHDLAQVQRATGDHPAVLHLLALVEKKRGDLAAAADAFARALTLAPTDPQIASNYANLLVDMGDADAALSLYDRALASQSNFADARFNRALLFERSNRLTDALADLDSLCASSPGHARAHSARGGILRKLGRLVDAGAAYDAALKIEPRRPSALHGRARVAMEQGDASASARYAQAIAVRPDDSELLLGLAQALEAEGNPRGIAVLTEQVARRPDWIAGHDVLARMRREAGEGDQFAEHFRAALAQRPTDRALHQAYWNSLARAQCYDEALAALRAARPLLADDPALALTEAVLTSEAGDPHRALALLDAIEDGGPNVLLTRGRAALRAGDPAQAVDMLQRVVTDDPGSINGWAHLDLGWRLMDDDRHDWLSGRPGLTASRDLGLDVAELDDLAQLLRTLHVTRAHPIGQSLRGGTQTRGRLFDRCHPALVRLHDALLAAVHDHIGALPARDERHPLLRHRHDPVAITGAWSVRLTDGGFHVNHIHPEGILSSAFYVALPDAVGTGAHHEGWLELGRPPAELGLRLDPLVTTEPRRGRLALFPSYLFHGTRPFADGERLTVAFDVAVV